MIRRSALIPSPTLPAAERALPFRARPELSIYRLDTAGVRMWGVKDPVSLRYYQIGDEERFILGCLDQRASLEEIRRRFMQTFSPKTISLRRLHEFLATLHEQGLIVSERSGQAAVLGSRRNRQRRDRFWSVLANPLAVRFRGIDPDRFLNWVYRCCRGLFTPMAFAASILLMLSALAVVALHPERLMTSLADFPAFCTPGNLTWLAVVILALKVLHELGHALACKHFGAECHELGLMLLVFAPCLYCNVSDAWTLPQRWKRIAISAAGMYMECTIAAVCALVWYASEPGPLHSIALKVMLVGSVSTVVFNGNPLLRYDGYYILSDLVEVPNLGQRASAALRALAGWWFLGRQPAGTRDTSLAPRQWLLGLYAACSAAYRWAVVLLFLWLAHAALKPLHLELVSALVATVFCITMLAPLAMAAGSLWRPTPRPRRLSATFLVRGGTTAAALLALLLVPLPRSLVAPLSLAWHDARRVYVTVPGALQESVAAGTRVSRGQVLARLESPEVAMDIEKLRGECGRQRMRVDHLRRQSIRDAQAAALLPTAEQALADGEERLRERMTDSQRLTLTAPIEGVVLPPPERAASKSQTMLDSWSGSPLDEKNRHAWLATGTLVCLVGDPKQQSGTLVVDEADIALVRVGQKVRIWLEALPDRTLDGTIAEVSEVELAVAPTNLTVRGELPTKVDAEGLARPRRSSYQARVTLEPLEGSDAALLADTGGRARIRVAPCCLAERLYRFLRRTFHIDVHARLPGARD